MMWRIAIFKEKVAVITDGANGIEKCIAEEFQKNGADVCVIDKADGTYFVGDIADKSILERFAESIVEEYGHIDYLINNAVPLMKGIHESVMKNFNMQCL